MPAPETTVRQRVKDIVAQVYAVEAWTAIDDKLPRSTGHDRDDAVLAVSPEESYPDPANAYCLLVPVFLQLYLPYNAEVDERQEVDPSIIEDLGDRLRAGFADNNSGTTADMWYLSLDRIVYPDDPTGNKTRLEAFITGRAENTAAY